MSEIISSGTKAIGSLIDSFFGQIIHNILLIVFGLTVIAFIDYKIFLFFILFFIPIFLWYSIKEIKKRIPNAKKLNNKKNKVLGESVEYLSNVRDIKIFGVQKYFMKLFKNSFTSIFNLEMKIEKSHHYMNFFQFILLIGSMCLILLYTGYNITEGIFTIGIFILVFHIFNSIRFALWNMVSLYRNTEENIIKVKKLLDFFELSEQNILTEELYLDFKLLEIKNLSFSYEDKIEILKNINFNIRCSEKIAIIGKSGQGKTTLISLILGLFDGYSGNILFNGKEAKLNQKNLFSYVAQDTKMFNQTIRFNLTLGENFDDKTLIKILKDVGLYYLSSRAKKGKNILDIMVGSSGLKLSGGERQRLGIARAMIREKSIYIFDEITSNLDEDTEKEILDLIFSIASKKTFIIITHKKEVLKKVDSIYEMKLGKLKKVLN